MTGARATLPATLDDAVRVVLAGMDEPARARLRAMPREALITLHHGLGTAIRNQLGLWGENPALIAACRTFDPFEPDAASQVILARVWAVLAVDPEPSDASRLLEPELASALPHDRFGIRMQLARLAIAERRWDAAEVLVQAMLEQAALEEHAEQVAEAERLRIELWIESGRRVPEALDAVRASTEGRPALARLELWGWEGRAAELQGDELQSAHALGCMRTLVTNEHRTTARDAVRGFYALPPRLLDRAAPSPHGPAGIELGVIDSAELLDDAGAAHPRGPLSEVVFGPRRDLVCACGACSGFRMAGRRCPQCAVEVLPSITRTLRCAELRLSIPLLHPGHRHTARASLAQALGISEHMVDALALHETSLPDPRPWTGPRALLQLAHVARLPSEHPEAHRALEHACIRQLWIPPPDATLDLGDGVQLAHAPFRAALGALVAAEAAMKRALREREWTEAWRRPAHALSLALDQVYWAARGTSR